jgi:hypothetical protein
MLSTLLPVLVDDLMASAAPHVQRETMKSQTPMQSDFKPNPHAIAKRRGNLMVSGLRLACFPVLQICRTRNTGSKD